MKQRKQRKQRNDNNGCCSNSEWTTEEIEVAETIMEWERRRLVLDSIPSSWVCKKKRSVLQIQDTLSPSSQQLLHGGAAAAVMAAPVVVKEQALSPITPLSFLPAAVTTESEEIKPKIKKSSLKRKRKHYLQLIQDLTKTKADLNQEIQNAELKYQRLKAMNLDLKIRSKILNCQIDKALQPSQVNSSNLTVENKEQKNQQMQMPNQNFVTSQMISTTSVSYHPRLLPMACHCSSSTSTLGSNKGPRPLLPDLNLPIEELSNVELCQPTMDLSRVMAAQARQRRLQIFRRRKKPIGISS